MEVKLKIAVLSSYHGQRAKDFEHAGDLFRPINAELIHPPSFKLLNPEDIFVFREGDKTR